VASVSFYDGSKLIAQDTTGPYSYRWNVAAVGNHVLTARATDNAGATTTSSIVTITVRKKR
jgi:chitinase